MSFEAYESALAIVAGVPVTLAMIAGHRDDGILTEQERLDASAQTLHDMMAPVDAALTSSPDPRDDAAALIRAALACIDAYRDRPDVPPHPKIAEVQLWLLSRASHADELRRVVATVAAWEEEPPQLASLRAREAAVAVLARAREAQVQHSFNVRAVVAALRAFGPRLLVTMAEDYLANHLGSRMAWDQLLRAMDEVAYWAGATDTPGVPEDYRGRAVQALLDVAGHPELTLWAVLRLPMHRLTGSDRRELGGILADRWEVMPSDWLADPDRTATMSVEVALLRALDQASAQWPGARADY